MIEFDGFPDCFDVGLHERWLLDCAESYGKKVSKVLYHLVSDEKILDVNRSFLSHDYYTDIITFQGESKRIQAEIFVSGDTVRSNARQIQTPMELEMRRVLAHGLLHCIGFEDQTLEKQKVMREEEEFCIHLHPLKNELECFT